MAIPNFTLRHLPRSCYYEDCPCLPRPGHPILQSTHKVPMDFTSPIAILSFIILEKTTFYQLVSSPSGCHCRRVDEVPAACEPGKRDKVNSRNWRGKKVLTMTLTTADLEYILYTCKDASKMLFMMLEGLVDVDIGVVGRRAKLSPRGSSRV